MGTATTLNSVNIDALVYSKKYLIDDKGGDFCILRVKVINTHKGKITDVNLLDCFGYNRNFEFIKNELKKDMLVRINGKLQKRNTKDWTLKVNSIKILEEKYVKEN